MTDRVTLGQDIERVVGTEHAQARTAAVLACTERPLAYQQLLEMARGAGFDATGGTLLLLKYEIERQQSTGRSSSFMGHSLLKTWPMNDMADALQSTYGVEPPLIADQLLIQLTEMMTLGLPAVALHSDALRYYARQRLLTLEQAAQADDVTRRQFDELKAQWLGQNEELADLMVAREDSTLRAEARRQAFMRHFAKEFLKERRAHARLEVARVRLDLIKRHPDWSHDALEAHLAEELQRRHDKLKAYELSSVYALQSSPRFSPNDRNEDFQTAKHLLRRLAMLTHPDRTRQQQQLTAEQRRQLEDLWHDVSSIRADHSDGVLCRNVDRLRYNVALAEQILTLAGVEDLDASLTIQGATLAERVEWLERACSALDAQIVVIQAELFALGRDPELQYMQALLDAPEHVQEEERETLSKCAGEHRAQALQLEARISQLLAGTSA